MDLKQLSKDIIACQKCDLRLECTQPVPGIGESNAQYFIIGEAPGQDEDKSGVPFTGMSGRRLNRLLELAKIDINDCYLTNVVKCRPVKNKAPGKQEIKSCLQWLLSELAVINPSTIITLGATPLSLFSEEGIRTLHGTMLLDAEIMPKWMK